MKKRIHYRDTTAQQGRHLFETWEATGNVTEACRQAHVGRGTFYYWKSRFDEHGYAGLEAFESKAPKNPRRTSPEVEAQVIAMRRDHPKWGRQRIADELAKANGWKPLVSANTVKRILKDAGQLETIEAEVKKIPEEQEAFKSLPKEERQQQKAAKEAADENWRRRRENHSAKQEQRKEEDKEWREKRNSLRERMSRLPAVMAWVAILVVIDNCTRQCFGLPLFVVGPHVTSEMIVEALESLLPPELQFLISDRGIHFKANVFKNFLLSKEVIHVLISRQRPETNGIAERFVRTLKDWLEDKTWSSDEELADLLEQIPERIQ